MDTFELNSGNLVPAVGFGTYLLRGASGVQAITAALKAGYRFLDTAYNYENEGTVGAAVRQSGLPRSAVQIESKLPGRYYHRADALDALKEGLFRAGLDYFDLYLLHWPNPKRDLYGEAWQALIEAQQLGLVIDIGVCNFLPAHLAKLEKATGVLPAINQIELHPRFNQADLRAYDTAHGILTQAWSPLGRASTILQNPTLAEIGRTHGKTISQVILRWDLQHAVMPLPKSQHPHRQRENLALFDFTLSAEEMTAIDRLSQPDGRLKNQDPATYEEF